jgi:hypothetical protein
MGAYTPQNKKSVTVVKILSYMHHLHLTSIYLQERCIPYILSSLSPVADTVVGRGRYNSKWKIWCPRMIFCQIFRLLTLNCSLTLDVNIDRSLPGCVLNVGTRKIMWLIYLSNIRYLHEKIRYIVYIMYKKDVTNIVRDRHVPCIRPVFVVRLHEEAYYY